MWSATTEHVPAGFAGRNAEFFCTRMLNCASRINIPDQDNHEVKGVMHNEAGPNIRLKIEDQQAHQ